ncbi:ParA family protein (plasmid) [Enterococcus faecalis]
MLSRLGFKVLVVDADPQANTTKTMLLQKTIIRR